MFWIPLAMAAAGAAKGEQDRNQAERDRKAEAEIARWSPWTGMQAQRVKDGGGALGGAMAGGLQGASFLQSMNAAGYGKESAPAGNLATTSQADYLKSPQPTAAPQAPVQSSGQYALYGAPENKYRNLSLYGQPNQNPGQTWLAAK